MTSPRRERQPPTHAVHRREFARSNANGYDSAMDVLAVAGAVKRFGSVVALDRAQLTLRAGEWLALLGPNGAGKTTLVRAVAGGVRLDEGEITLLGAALPRGRAPGDGRERLGVVPQEIALFPLLTARENLVAFGRLHGVAAGDLPQRVAWGLDWTALADRADEPVRRFSGGMKRRLNIACGVLHRPAVVLLDEPTVGVDPQSRERIWQMLGELRRAGASLLLTTHQLDEAQRICDRIVIIDHGRAVAAGTLDELVERTIGAGRRVTLTLDQPPDGDLVVDGFVAEGRVLRGSMGDVAGELPALLGRIRTAGRRVDDVHVEPPSLHAVFLHLTGRELRE